MPPMNLLFTACIITWTPHPIGFSCITAKGQRKWGPAIVDVVHQQPYRGFVYHRGGAEKMGAPAIVDVANQQPYRGFVYHREGAEKMGAPAIVDVAHQQPYRVSCITTEGQRK